MKSFHALGWFGITGGMGCEVSGDELALLDDVWDPAVLTGEDVFIDGKQYKVRGVETFRIFCDSKHPYKLNFGLIVEESVAP